MLRIGIDALGHPTGGVLRHFKDLIEEWGRLTEADGYEFVLFASGKTVERLSGHIRPSIKTVRFSSADKGFTSRLFIEQVVLPRLAKRFNIQAFFSPGNTFPLVAKVPSVVTFSNAGPSCASFSLKTVGIANWSRARMVGVFHRFAGKRASRVITLSRYYRNYCTTRYKLPAEKAINIYHARDPIPTTGEKAAWQSSVPAGVKPPFAAYVGDLHPYKNINEMIEAFALACRTTGRSIQLVVAGAWASSSYRVKVMRTVDRLRLGSEDVLFTGFVPNQQVKGLLAGCELYIFPSTCENCPVALLESLAMGVPIASSNVCSMPEIGGDAVLYFDPYDIASISRTLLQLMTDWALCNELRHKSAERAALFPDRAQVARQTLEVISSAAAHTKQRNSA